jgi:branched-chain amino acid transport system permease protein
MMRVRPEGLWPSATRRRELRDEAGESAVNVSTEAQSLAAGRTPDLKDTAS